MAIAVEQSANNTTGDGNTLDVSFGSLPSTDNIVVAMVGWRDLVSSTNHDDIIVTDNQSNTYTLQVGTDDQTLDGCRIFTAPINTSSGTFTVTLELENAAVWNTGELSITIAEVSGADEADLIDQSGYQTETSTIPVLSLATMSSDTEVFAVGQSEWGITVTVGSGWTELYDIGLFCTEHRTGDYDPTVTWNTSNPNYLAGIGINAAAAVAKALAGTIAAISGFSGTLNRSRVISGNLSAVSALSSAPVLRSKLLSGSFDAVSAFAGALSKAGAVAKALAGTIAAISGFSGTANRSRVISGNLSAVSSVLSAPINRLKRFAASFAVVSAFTGALTKAVSGTKALAGTIAAVSTVTGGVIVRSRLVQGSFAAVSTFTAAPLNRLKNLTSSFSVVSTLVGDLTRTTVAGAEALAGTIAASSAITGTITVLGRWRQATIQGVDAVTGKFVNIVGNIRFNKEK